MPELPEVETVARQLNDKIKGKTVNRVEIFDQKVIDSKLKVVPYKIKSIYRRGKSIIMALNNEKFILTHLRMTGHFYYDPKEKTRYCAALFHFSDNTTLSHNSIRRFGHMKLLSKKELDAELKRLGPEPLEITEKEFVSLLDSFPQANLKNKLLDQHCIVGIGNIYAQEAMYSARIHPEKKIADVSPAKLKQLHHHVQRILNLSIVNNGTTVYNYANIDGKGDFQHLLSVYGKEKCPQGHQIRKIQIGGRGTYYCDRCQR
ncbi:hypothetical protein COV20_02295 [Candidatus Woesearchaeota archaeon CG10_big_fil_rev_8_21_14_0_10_45_16]|nr:MAG: hypothetical protein COV20_02295 [Candidatus Woesearchaeota archaeon CG10_big_fil_rev_8_21_14_0_10_45_16]